MGAEKPSSGTEEFQLATSHDNISGQLKLRFEEQTTIKYNTTTTTAQRVLPVNLTPLRPSLTRHVTSSGHPLEPMSRNYPRPLAEAHIDELLARPPLKGTFSYNLQNNKDNNLEGGAIKEAADPDGLARAKQHWLRIAEELKQLWH